MGKKNIYIRLNIALICIFIISISFSINLHVSAKHKPSKNLLILHSYGYDFKWTRDISTGITSALDTDTQNINFTYEYMDSNKITNNDYLKDLYEFQRKKYKNRHFDVIISSDNDALNYLVQYGDSLFPNTPVVFCGINGFKDSLIKKRDLYTGITEDIDVEKTIDCIGTLQPNVKNIVVICDSTTTGKINKQKIKSILPKIQNKFNLIFCEDVSLHKLNEKLKSLGNNTVILHAGQLRNNQNNLIPYEKIGKVVKVHTNVANYGLWDFFIGEGILGGRITSASYQGNIAGNLALRILRGENPSKIPIVKENTTRYVFDYIQLKKFKINTKNLPEGSTVINTPFSFYETYKTLTVSVLFVIILLSSTIIVMLINIKKRKLSEKKLKENYNELSLVYEELSVTEEELREQYKNLQELEENAIYKATHDDLTNLANRRYFMNKLNALLSSTSERNEKGAILFIDLDDFKKVNDTLGHNYGDKLLKHVAKILDNTCEKNSLVCRLGGDEFVILQYGIENYDQVTKFSDKIIGIFKEPFQIEDKQIFITASMGITLYPDDSKDATEILKNADTAMYKAKETGKNKYQFFNKNMFEELLRKTEMEKDLRTALLKNQFELYYQPKIDANSGKINGLESLIRWKNGDKFISPMEFIPIAEECGLIIPIGEWILRTACIQNKKWLDEKHYNTSIAVNISSVQLQNPNFLSIVEKILNETQLPPKLLEIELTESILMQLFQSNVDTLKKLKDLGIKISLDDFGTGYSSLSYLRVLPIDTLKIDKSFIDDISLDPKEASIVDGIIQLAHKMNLNVVAEGVEDSCQLKILQKIECNEIQGYLFSKPLPANEVEQVIKENSFEKIAKHI